MEKTSPVNIPHLLQKMLHERSIYVKIEWIQECISRRPNLLNTPNDSKFLLELVYQQFLQSDLRDIGESQLPSGVSNLHEQILVGSFVLQVLEMWNVSESFELRKNQVENVQRMLKLHLTDGKQDCVGLEYRPIPHLKLGSTLPGSKLKVTNCMVRRGLLFLQSDCVTVLGGNVEELVLLQQQTISLHPSEYWRTSSNNAKNDFQTCDSSYKNNNNFYRSFNEDNRRVINLDENLTDLEDLTGDFQRGFLHKNGAIGNQTKSATPTTLHLRILNRTKNVNNSSSQEVRHSNNKDTIKGKISPILACSMKKHDKKGNGIMLLKQSVMNKKKNNSANDWVLSDINAKRTVSNLNNSNNDNNIQNTDPLSC